MLDTTTNAALYMASARAIAKYLRISTSSVLRMAADKQRRGVAPHEALRLTRDWHHRQLTR